MIVLTMISIMRLSLLLHALLVGTQVHSLQQPSRHWIRQSSPQPTPSNPAVRISALFSASSPPASSSMGGDRKEEWTKPRIHNTAAFRSVAILGAITAAGVSTPMARLSAQATAALHLFSFSTWFGTLAYTTFVLGITMFKNLPRQTFGKLQAKLFPKYFMLSSVAIILQVSRY